MHITNEDNHKGKEQLVMEETDRILDEYISLVGERTLGSSAYEKKTTFNVNHITQEEKTRYFTFLGNGGGFVNAHSTSGYREKDDNLLLVGCGYDIVPQIQQHLDKKYASVDIVITHMHADQIGGLASVVDFFEKKGTKINIISPCEKISTYLDKRKISKNVDLTDSDYMSNLWDINFFETKHVPEIDSYGFVLKDKEYIPSIIFVGPNSQREVNIPQVEGLTELYIEGSHGVNRPTHLPIETISIPGNEGTRNVVLTNIATNDINKLKEILQKNGLRYEIPDIKGER
jgi:phosphoribosyl 1,2-cyclic phosphodiesterase